VDWYTLFKFLHVAAAIIWIGSGFGLVVLGIAARRSPDRDAYLRVIQQVIFLAPRLFVPSSLAALVFGVLAAWMWGLGWLWIWIGIIGFAATFSTGNFLIRPRADKIGAMMASQGYSDAAATELGEEVLAIAKFDYLMLFVVVADMVFKPGWSEWPFLLVMILVLLGGATAFLMPVIRKEMAAYGIRV
jgi:uncharacterized membrane protein